MDTYQKNLQALKKNRYDLYEKLQTIKTNENFEVFLPPNKTYANLLDKKNNILFYDDADKVIASQIEEFKKYREYPFLYLFGVSNGGIINYLLKNEKLKQLVVIEPNIELIYIALNLFDFSDDLKTNRLVLIIQEELTKLTITQLIHNSNAKFYIKTFDLLLTSSYYEKIYNNLYIDTYKKFTEILNYIAQANGNDINDTFRGVKQHFENINLMLNNYKFKELLKYKNSDLAVIVSTGPSLTKQLPLLKEYQDYITIISVDASFPILVKHDIKPDIVVSMERDEPTSKFFKEVPKEKQKDIIFLCASLQHKSVFESIKDGYLVVAMRPFAYNLYFELDEYGYICKGMSSANMAHELASMMGYKQCAFIGQDLAFGNGLKTHADEHVITDINPSIKAQIDSNKLFEIEAYGGDGVVKTNKYWKIFKDFIEQHIELTKDFMTSYNSTEGGARIYGAIEKPFKEVLEKFCLKEKKKHIKLTKIQKDDIYNLKQQTIKKLNKILKESKPLQNNINKAFLKVAEESKKLENKDIKECINVFSMGETLELLNTISDIRNKIESNDFYNNFLNSIAQPLLYNMEMELAEIKVRYIDNPTDNQIKAIQWILSHRYWLFSLSGIIENLIHITQSSIKNIDT